MSFPTLRQLEYLVAVAEQPLAPMAPIRAVGAALQALSAIAPDLDPRRASPGQTHGLARPVLRAARKASQPPRLLNADGHDILLVTATIGLPWAEVVEALRGWPDAWEEETWVDLFGIEPVDYMGHPAVRATFRLADGAVTLYANSRERFDEALGRWATRTGRPLPVVSEEVDEVDSNPDGEAVIFDTQKITAPQGTSSDEVERSFRDEQKARWLDNPVPALGGLSPRRAAGVPSLEPLLWTLLHRQDERALVHALGLRLPALE